MQYYTKLGIIISLITIRVLKMKEKYNTEAFNHCRPNVGVTVCPFIYDKEKNEIKTLIYKRNKKSEVFPNEYALSNSFYDISKMPDLDYAAHNALREKSNIDIPLIKQLKTYSGTSIDPERINTVNVSYWAILRYQDVLIEQPLSEYDAEWVTIDEAIDKVTAFNHKDVLKDAIKELKEKSSNSDMVFDLLPIKFTISELQTLLEILLETKLDKARFRERIKKYNVLEEISGEKRTGPFRPAKLYRKRENFVGNFFPKTLS